MMGGGGVERERGREVEERDGGEKMEGECEYSNTL